SSRFGLRISVAKDLLEELERKKIVELVSRSRKTKIYKVAA
ncbi:MAG: 30S ribosomal protein S25e, partial [Candidatus Aenigmatarchaeota archaeon]